MANQVMSLSECVDKLGHLEFALKQVENSRIAVTAKVIYPTSPQEKEQLKACINEEIEKVKQKIKNYAHLL